MARTTAQYLSSMRHAIAGDPADGINLLQTLNDSVRELFNAHAWHWSIPEPVSVSLVQAQAYAALPADFGQLISLNDSSGDFITIVPLAELQKIRNGGRNDYDGLIAALSHPNQTAANQARGRARLELYPTPAAAGTLYLVYRSAGKELAADSDIPNIPPEFEPALMCIARGNIKGLDIGDWSEHERGLAMLEELAGVDGSETTDLGQIEGGIVRPGRMGE